VGGEVTRDGDVTVKPLSAKHQAFVDAYVTLRSATKAYQQVYGGVANVAAAAGTRLLKSVKVRAAVDARLNALAKKVDKKVDVSVERILAEYERLAFSDLGDFVEITPNGIRVKPTVDAGGQRTSVDTRCLAEASETVTETTFGDVTTVKRQTRIKLHAKHPPLRDLAEYQRLFEPKPLPPSQDRLPMMFFVQYNELERTTEGRIVRVVAPHTLDVQATEALPVMDVPTYGKRKKPA
jgi:hypothetical protein